LDVIKLRQLPDYSTPRSLIACKSLIPRRSFSIPFGPTEDPSEDTLARDERLSGSHRQDR